MIGDYAEDGLKDIDIESKLLSIKISWVRRLKDSNVHPWKELATYFLLPLGGDSVFQSNLSLAPSLKAKCESLPTFYSEVIKLWEKFSVCSKLRAEANQNYYRLKFHGCDDLRTQMFTHGRS